MQIFDTHTHDYFESFDEDRDEMMAQNFSSQGGVIGKVQIGCDIKTSQQALNLAKKHPKIWSTVGLHPCEVAQNFADIENIFKKFQDMYNENKTKIIGIGETGLDFYHNDSPQMREEQKISFTKHLEFGKKNNLPVIIHTRDAAEETIAFMRENKKIIGKGVIHCFSQDASFAKIATQEFGYFLGIGGVITYPKNQYIREAIEQTPLEFLVTETDSPYLSPQSTRGKRNHSGNIKEIILLIAKLKNIAPEKCEKILIQNAKKLFTLPL